MVVVVVVVVFVFVFVFVFVVVVVVIVVAVVVECYCFLINIIVDARRRATPQKPMRFCYFQQKCVHSSHKTMGRRI